MTCKASVGVETLYIENLCVLECEIVAAVPNFNWSSNLNLLWIPNQLSATPRMEDLISNLTSSFFSTPTFQSILSKDSSFQCRWKIWRNISDKCGHFVSKDSYFHCRWEIWRNISGYSFKRFTFLVQMRKFNGIFCLVHMKNLTEHIFSADEKFDGTYQTNVVVGSDGHCLFIPPGIFKVKHLTN